jgi:translation initiation factor 2 beta subunit (eIF-2beta)/eIF-5
MLHGVQVFRLDSAWNETLKRKIIMACSSCGSKKPTQNIVVKTTMRPIIKSIKTTQVKVVRH